MKKFFLALFLLANVIACFADSRVFTLVNPNPEEVLESLRNTYGDKVQADIVQGRLLVVGTKQQLDEIAALLVKLDPAPRALRLTVREQPPADDDPNSITYSTGKSGYTIDTVEGAFVSIDYQKIVQQPTAQGWWIAIENVPAEFNTLTLQVRIEGGRRAIIRTSYAREENQERRIFSNTTVGNLGTWIPLLPRPADNDSNTISTRQRRGDQLYLRVDKNFGSKKID